MDMRACGSFLQAVMKARGELEKLYGLVVRAGSEMEARLNARVGAWCME